MCVAGGCYQMAHISLSCCYVPLLNVRRSYYEVLISTNVLNRRMRTDMQKLACLQLQSHFGYASCSSAWLNLFIFFFKMAQRKRFYCTNQNRRCSTHSMEEAKKVKKGEWLIDTEVRQERRGLSQFPRLCFLKPPGQARRFKTTILSTRSVSNKNLPTY